MKGPGRREPSALFVVGPQRSGTTLMYDVLSCSQQLAGISEARNIWDWGNWRRGDDVLTRADVTRRKRRRTYARLSSILEAANGAKTFIEKSPSNCFRVDYLATMLPNARFIVIRRNGIDAIQSTYNVVNQQSYSWNRIGKRLTRSTLSELPAMLTRLPTLWGKLFGRAPKIWGVRPPGWKSMLGNSSNVAAFQWCTAMSRLNQDLDCLDRERYAEIRYEDLVSSPAETLAPIVQFAGLVDGDRVVDRAVAMIRKPGGAPEYTCLENMDIELIDEINNQQRALGYPRVASRRCHDT